MSGDTSSTTVGMDSAWIARRSSWSQASEASGGFPMPSSSRSGHRGLHSQSVVSPKVRMRNASSTSRSRRASMEATVRTSSVAEVVSLHGEASSDMATSSTSRVVTQSATQMLPRAPPLIMKRSSINRRSSVSKLMSNMGGSSRDLYELQVKTANYEAMMQRFQLRKVAPDENAANNRFSSKRLVIDKYVVNGDSSPLKRRRSWPSVYRSRFSLNRLWRQRHEVYASMTRALRQPLTPQSLLFKLHGILMMIVFNAELVYLPFAPAYLVNDTTVSVTLELIVEAVLLWDMLLHFNIAYTDSDNRFVMSRRAIAWRYVRSWFVVDLLSSIPVRMLHSLGVMPMLSFMDWNWGMSQLVMIPRLVHISIFLRGIFLTRLLRLGRGMIVWLFYSRYSHLMGIARLLWLVVLTTHYMACFWRWVSRDHHVLDSASVIDQYVADHYYAVLLIQGQGDGIRRELKENIFSIVAVVFGSVILAIVFGNVAMLVSNFNANETNYQRKMEVIFATMNKLKLPDALRERIHQYYAHLWQEYESLDGDIVRFSRELTHTLALEVGLFKYMNLVMDIPFWKDCSPDFVTQLVLNLVVRVYLPDDYVIRKGVVGDELYMINRGICEVHVDNKRRRGDADESHLASQRGKYSSVDDGALDRDQTKYNDDAPTGFVDEDDGEDSIASSMRGPRDHWPFSARDDMGAAGSMTARPYHYPPPENRNRVAASKAKKHLWLYPGQAFGEMSLLMNYRRTASVRAVTYVEMCILQRPAFQQMLARYSSDRRNVLRRMLQNCIERDEIPFPWERVCAEELAARGPGPLTSAEAAEMLVNRIDVELVDETIKYGFQSFEIQNSMSASAGESAEEALDGDMLQRLERVEENQSQMLELLNEVADVVSRIDGELKVLRTRGAQPSRRRSGPMHESGLLGRSGALDDGNLLSGVVTGGSKSNGPRLQAVRSAPSESTVELPSGNERPGGTSSSVLDRSRSEPSQVLDVNTFPPAETSHPSDYDGGETTISIIHPAQEQYPTQSISAGRTVDATESSPSARRDTEVSLDSGREFDSFERDLRQSAGEEYVQRAAAPRMALPPLKGVRTRTHSSYVSQESSICISEEAELEATTVIASEPRLEDRPTISLTAEQSIKPPSSTSSQPEDEANGIRTRFVRPFISRRSSAPSGVLVGPHPHHTDSSPQPRAAGGIIAALTASNPFISRQPRGRQSPLQSLADQLWSRNESSDEGEKPPRRKTSHPTLAVEK